MTKEEHEAELDRLMDLPEDEFNAEAYNLPRSTPEPAKEETVEDETEEDETPDEVEQEPVVETTEEPETVEEMVERLTKESLTGKKAVLKYNGEDTEVDGDELINLAQIGMHAGIVNYKDAVELKKSLDAAGVSKDEIEILRKLKSGDTRSLLELMKSNKLDIESVQDLLYDVDKDSYVEDMNRTPVVATEFDRYIQSVPESVHKKYNEVAPMIPGMDGYNKRLSATGNAESIEAMESLVSGIESGVFDKIAPYVARKYGNLSDREKYMIESNNNSFLNFYNGVITEVYQLNDNHVVTNAEATTEGTTPVSKRVSAEAMNSKRSMSKPTNTPIVGDTTGSKKKSPYDILDEIEGMDEEQLNKYLRENK